MPFNFKEEQARKAAEAKAEAKAEAEAERILKDKIARKTSGAPTLDQVLLAGFKYGGVFKMGDGEVHYRITIPTLGRVIHCHTKAGGMTLTKAHMKPKIKETGSEASVIRGAAKEGKFTRHDVDQGLVFKKKTYADSKVTELVRNELIHGTYAKTLIDGAMNLQDYELNFYSEHREGNPWGAKADQAKHKQIIQKIKGLSPEILFNVPA